MIVVGQSRLLRDQSMADFIATAAGSVVRVRSPQLEQLRELLERRPDPGVTVRRPDTDGLEVEGMTSEQIGTLAAQSGLTLFELATIAASLEDAYMALTADSRDYRALDPRLEEPTLLGVGNRR